MEGHCQYRVLIVDSDQRALEVIRNVLVSDGLNVTTASGGEAALDALRSCEYDLILVDTHFADLTSSCFLKHLLRVPGKASVIVLESFSCPPCGLAPYNFVRAVNKWRAYDILAAVREMQSGPSLSEGGCYEK